MTPIVKKWHHEPSLNKGMIVKAVDEDKQESLLGFPIQRQNSQDLKPRLDLTLLVPDNKPLSVNTLPKIAILTPQLLEWSGSRCLFGGGERYLIDFANLLQTMGFIVDVFQPSTLAWEKHFDGIRIIGIENSGIEVDFLADANRSFFNHTVDYDFHVYFNLNVVYPDVFPDSICINHGIWWDSTERPWWRTEEWYRRLFSGLEKVDTLVSVDTNTINWLNAVKPELKLKKIYIPNYVDLNLVGSITSSHNGDDVNILFPRRLHSQRGWLITKRVASELEKERTNLRFLFVGRGNEESEASMRIFAASHPRIKYSWYDMHEMYQVYRDSDIVLKNAILYLVDNPDLRLEMGKNAKIVANQFSKTVWEARWKNLILQDKKWRKY